MDKGKKLGAIAVVGAMALTYGIVAASASTSGTATVSPLTLSPSTSIPITTTPIVPLIPLSGELGSNQAPLLGGDDSATETSDGDSLVNENSSNQDGNDDGNDDSAVSDTSVNSDDGGDSDSVNSVSANSSDDD